MNWPFWLCVVKAAMDAFIAAGMYKHSPALALMFAGYALADAGAAWVAR
jgi:hypothetical protein